MAASTRIKPLVYRVEEISTVKSKEDLLLLFPTRTRDRMTVTSLGPSINVDRRTLTATISFLPLSDEPFPIHSDPDICIDKDFYGFTPLYTPEGQINVDIIAITGLAGHAFGSWSTPTQKMWLRDFLPRDIPRARILLYGYDSHIVNSQSRSILADFSSNFIAKFSAMRAHSHSENRPVIFIGHSLGCLMIKEVLIDLALYVDRRGGPTRPTVKSIIFFGAPHRGLEVTAMQSMVHGMPSEDLVGELKRHSPTLRRLNDGFRHVYEDVNILTIYEMEPTASLRKGEFDTWERTGPPVMMVEKDSAILDWPMEELLGLNRDHSRIAKVDRGQNGCYDDICHFLQRSLYSTGKASIMPIANALPLHSSASPSSSKNKLELGRDLCKAIKNGDSRTAQDLVQLVENGSLAGPRDSPLILAIQYCPEIVSTLLDAGADLSARDGQNGSQAIHFAGHYAKSPDTVQLLLDAGAVVNASNTSEITPLHIAASNNNNLSIIQALIDAGATVNIRDSDGNTPLHLAASNNNNPSIIQVLIDAGAAVTAINTYGRTPLHRAAQNSTSEGVVKALILASADINARDADQVTPLQIAASRSKTTVIITALIEANADVNAINDRGNSSLILSAPNENPEICRELLKAGAHHDQKDQYGCTALYWAIEKGNKEAVRYLLEYGADPRTMSRNVVAPSDLRFDQSVPSAARSDIRKLIIRATERKAQDKRSKHGFGFAGLSLGSFRRPN